MDNLISNGLLPVTTHPTRLSSRTATLLDFISTSNIYRNFSTGIITSSLADHFPVYYTSSINKEVELNNIHYFRDFSETNTSNFKALLSKQKWEEDLKIKFCQQAFDSINSKVNAAFLESYPVKSKIKNKACNPIKPWITKGLLISRKSKEK